MPKKGANISLSSYDDIFSTEESRKAETKKPEAGEQVQELSLDELTPFKNHPFKVIDNEEMEKTVESIKEFGVLTPVIVRPIEGGGYEIVSGHRRHHASQLAGLTTIPCIVRNLDDDAATILMVDANLQRENISPMEKAQAYKMKLEAIKRQGKRNDLTSVQVGPKLDAAEKVAEESGDSRSQVKRYVRLTELIPPLQEMVDNKKLAVNPAVEISYLTEDQQKDLMEAMDYAQSTPSLSQAQRLKKMSKDKKCNLVSMCNVMSEEKKSDLDHIVLKNDLLTKYFPKSYTPKQMEETIVNLLEQWQKKKERNQSL